MLIAEPALRDGAVRIELLVLHIGIHSHISHAVGFEKFLQLFREESCQLMVFEITENASLGVGIMEKPGGRDF